MKTKVFEMDWLTVCAVDTTGTFFPATGWMEAGSVGLLRYTFELAGKAGNVSVSPAYQTANVESNPDSGVSFGSAQTSNGTNFPTAWEDISATTATRRLVRFGFWVKLTTGVSVAFGRAAGVVELQEC